MQRLAQLANSHTQRTSRKSSLLRPLARTVLHRLGDVGRADQIGSRQIGDGP
jgi:hypothetical protein